MNTLNGYSKSTLTDIFVLTASGGHYPFMESLDTLLAEISSVANKKNFPHLISEQIDSDVISSNGIYTDTISVAGLITSTATGVAPLVVSSNVTVANLNADLLDGYHSDSFIFNKHYKSLSELSTSTSGWYKICTITDLSGSPCLILVRAYAHSSVAFIVTDGWSSSGNITLLAYCSSSNASYAYILGARLLTDGTVEIKLHTPTSNSYVDISISIYNPNNVKTFSTLTLSTVTDSSTIVLSMDFVNNSILAYNVVTTKVTSAESLTLSGTSGLYLKYNNNDATSVVLNATLFKPFDAANSKLSLGATSARWNGLYTTTGNFSNYINIANIPTTWIGSMSKASIQYDSLNAISSSSYHPIIAIKSNGGNVSTMGGYINLFGFYGFKSGRTENTNDWYLYVDTSTGNWVNSHTIKSSGFIKANSSDSYVLLGGGGHKTISSFLTTYDARYVLKSGDTMTGKLNISTSSFGALLIERNDSTNGASILFKNTNGVLGYIGMRTVDGGLWRWSADTNSYYNILDTYNSSVSGGGSSVGSYITVNLGGTSKTLTIPDTVTKARYLNIHDIRNTDPLPNSDTYKAQSITAWFNNTGTPSSGWYSGITVKGWTNNYIVWLLCSYANDSGSNNYNLYFRNGEDETWGSWKTILDTSNFSSLIGTGLFTSLSSNTTNKITATIGGTTKNITTLYASYLCSAGVANPQTGRTQAYGNVYSYNTTLNYHEGAPTTYTSVMGFGRGTGGTVEICGEWTSGRGLWVRALRDTTDDWYDWIPIMTSNNCSVSGGGSSWGSSLTVKINGTSATLTIPSNPNTDTKVTLSQNTSSNYRPVVLGYSNASTAGDSALYANTTNVVYTTNTIYAKPSTGALYATTFVGNLSGNATTASKLGSNTLGGTYQPIYLSSGTATEGTSYAKAIKSIERSGTTFTYTCIDGTTGTFTLLDNNTHWTTRIYAGASGTIVNSIATNPYLKVTDDNTYRNLVRFVGNGATTVSSDDSGNITISSTNTTYSFSNNNPTLSWGNQSTVGTVGGVALTVTMPANPNTDTHYTTGINAGASKATSNSSVSNPYITIKDNSTYRGQIRLLGSGATTVKSDDSGNITISSTATEYSFDAKGSATKGIYLSSTNTFTEMNYSLNATVNSGTANNLAYYSGANAISAYSSTIGGTAKPMYLNAGVPAECSDTVGSGTKPVYMSSGTITASSSTVGDIAKPVYMSSGTITASTYSFKGTDTNPVIIWAGYLHRSYSSTTWYTTKNGGFTTASWVTQNAATYGYLALSFDACYIHGAFCTSISNYDGGDRYPYYTSSITGRSSGFGTFKAFSYGLTLYIRQYRLSNGDNDEWYDGGLADTSTKDGNKPLTRFYLMVVGYYYGD